MGKRALRLLCVMMMVSACGADVSFSSSDDEVTRDVPRDAQVDARANDAGATPSDEPSDASARDDASPSDGEASADAGGHGGEVHDAGAMGGDDGTNDAGDDVTPEPTGQPTFVAVGYAGRRVRSTDLGRTWTDDVTLGGGGDDEFLLRTVEFANGVFVAGGWKILTSPDGSADSWTERDNPTGQWLGQIAFGNGRFVGTGGYGRSGTSLDGVSWDVGGDLDTEASRTLAFGNGVFMSATDRGNWWTSTDGTSWSVSSGGHTNEVAFCGGDFETPSACSEPAGKGVAYGAGVWVRVGWNGIERSTNGVDFDTVSSNGAGLEDVAFGYVD